MIADVCHLIGPAGIALALVGLLGLYLAAANCLYLLRVRRDFQTLSRTMQMEGGCLNPEAKAKMLESRNPLVMIVRDVVMTHADHSDDIRAEVAYLFHKYLKCVNNGLCWIKLIAAISPLLGLMGTVLGMVEVFQGLAEHQAPDQSLLAAGIWQSLVTTVMGLVVAIPMLGVYYFLFLQVKGLRIEAIEFSYRTLGRVRTRRERTDN